MCMVSDFKDYRSIKTSEISMMHLVNMGICLARLLPMLVSISSLSNTLEFYFIYFIIYS